MFPETPHWIIDDAVVYVAECILVCFRWHEKVLNRLTFV
jgi:hypothetical protein